jgi:hypothetical protein
MISVRAGILRLDLIVLIITGKGPKKMKLTYTLLLSAFCIASQPARANINIVFDYGNDSTGFFTGGNSSRQTLLDAAASVFETRFSDNLTGITSSDSNHFNITFANPYSTGTTTLNNYSVAPDEIVVYVGAYNLGANILGQGGPGGFSVSGTQAFVDNAVSRGQPGALIQPPSSQTDFGPWGGSLSFNNTASYYFGTDAPPSTTSAFDFYSVAVHELGHLLGFGTADSYYHYVANGVFTGPAVNTLIHSNPPVTGDGHWASGTTYLGQEAAMTPAIAAGQRKPFTELDFAAMKDIGWQVTAVPEPETWGMLLAGLGLLGWRMRVKMVNKC